MGALAVVKAFDVIEDFSAGLAVAGKVSAIDEVEFESAPEAFHEGIIVAVSFAAHRGHQAGLTECLTEIFAGVLNAAIRVEEQIGWRCQQAMAKALRPGLCRGAHSWPSRRFCGCKGRGGRPDKASLPGFRCK